VAAGGEDAATFLDVLLAQQNSDGSMSASPDNWTTDTYGWLSHWRGLAATAWLYFAIKGQPFPEPTRDTDGDGQPDWAEFVTGNDPQNSASYFTVDQSSFERASATLRFSWPGTTNRFYTVLSAANMSGPWKVATNFTRVAGTGQRLQFSATMGDTANYFRVRCELGSN
jgi:hypothetical protein